MKKAMTTIDFVNDCVKMLDQTLNLQFTTSGHYIVPIAKTLDNFTKGEIIVLVNNNLMNDKDKVELKLHLQFGHARSHKVIDLVKDAGIEDKELCQRLVEFEDNCEVCQRYKQPKLRPAVSFSLAKDFNDAIAMDLKWCNGVLCLRLIDHMTRFSATAVIHTKEKEEVVDNIFKMWISLFGCSKKILSDNGGEFNNKLLCELGQLLNTHILCTSAESPWSNGITERHNGIIGNMVDKVMKDVPCSIIVALAWSVSAKNSLNSINNLCLERIPISLQLLRMNSLH